MITDVALPEPGRSVKDESAMCTHSAKTRHGLSTVWLRLRRSRRGAGFTKLGTGGQNSVERVHDQRNARHTQTATPNP